MRVGYVKGWKLDFFRKIAQIYSDGLSQKNVSYDNILWGGDLLLIIGSAFDHSKIFRFFLSFFFKLCLFFTTKIYVLQKNHFIGSLKIRNLEKKKHFWNVGQSTNTIETVLVFLKSEKHMKVWYLVLELLWSSS